MPPQESSHLLAASSSSPETGRKQHQAPVMHFSFGAAENDLSSLSLLSWRPTLRSVVLASVTGVLLVLLVLGRRFENNNNNHSQHHDGPYRLLESQQGHDFFKYYDFFEGPDSLGSAGYNVYVGPERAFQLGLAKVVEMEEDPTTTGTDDDSSSYVYLASAATKEGPRESIRLEGKRRFDRGLFILDLVHMPTGCGVWPAWWLTDEAHWPAHGEIDIVEGVNEQTVAKTALHTSESCSMYAHVPPYAKSGVWDTATGIPNGWTGEPDWDTAVEADNCWVSAPHQWANQGCVGVSTQNGTLGAPLNEQGGGVFVLEWDPEAGHIQSWVFPASDGYPTNLQYTLQSARHKTNHNNNNKQKQKDADDNVVIPDPSEWGAPYAYFAIGEKSGCSADHFQQMRLIFNLAFCGTVSGNRFFGDCPRQTAVFNQHPYDPINTCNEWIASNPTELQEAYWKIRGVYVYERE